MRADRILRARVRHAWDNTANPVVGRAHTQWDVVRGVPHVVSRVVDDPAAPTVGYRGFHQGLANVLQLTDVLRARSFPGRVEWTTEAPSRSARRASRQETADIELVGAPSGTVLSSPGDATVVLPFRVHLVVRTPDLATVRAHVSKRERPRFNESLRHERFRPRIVRDEASVVDFFHRMHRPTMQARHAEKSRTESLEAAVLLASRGGLFLSDDADGPVAGCLYTVRRGVFTTRLLGVRDGADEHYDSGAFKALYHLMMQHCALADGLETMDLFGTEAFCSKGIYQWKRRLGAAVVEAPNHFGSKQLLMSVTRDRPGVRRFLVENPVLARMPRDVTLHGSPPAADAALRPLRFVDTGLSPGHPVATTARGLEPELTVDLDTFLAAPASIAPRRTV